VRDAYRYILQVLRMVVYFNPIKVLMPLALLLFGVGSVKAVVDVVVYFFHVTTNAVLLIVTGLIIGAVALLADLIVRSRPD
jgi:ABC-type nitrate/sulfonate/bicarbonate transport system permease component